MPARSAGRGKSGDCTETFRGGSFAVECMVAYDFRDVFAVFWSDLIDRDDLCRIRLWGAGQGGQPTPRSRRAAPPSAIILVASPRRSTGISWQLLLRQEPQNARELTGSPPRSPRVHLAGL